ncbi:hypothetical protein FHX42_005121 [Saccharopolyspora lacisalsi]|uniref:Protein kinase domain-containing protein n=1 Tax=Halosaccharopolyspora lacisalsi TaxID=1000566 RepID=A0A839E524_9PSEU|nr:protein kinase family protein [Halosaccharopolyspora lacisalsi]MBA8827716.1 hypothetical protein [Halosaccharopolyspora lacisalsi]
MSGKPTEQAGPGHDDTEGGDAPHRQGLTPGAVLDHGRYRLLAQVGSDTRCDAQLWRAKDGVLGRDVALTILVGDRADSEIAGNARRTLERAMHASTFNHVGVARVLDVVNQSPDDPEGVLGMIIAEWTHGNDLLDLVSEGPLSPGTAARLLRPLAAAIEAAHHAGLVLGADHPQRVRITADGEIRMAFPGPLPRATSSDDVRGLGAALYLLTTGRWALSGGPEGTPTAPVGPDGVLVAPRTLRPSVPLELSTVAVRALGNPDSTGTTGGVRTGAAVLRVLEQHADSDSSTATMPASSAEDGSDEVWSTKDPAPDRSKRKKLMISFAVLAVAALLVISWMTVGLISMFTGPTTSGPSVLVGPDKSVTEQPRPTPEQARPVAASGADVFVAEQNRDNREDAGHVIDGDPGTHWETDGYNDQLGTGFKSGIGLVLTLERPTEVTEVTIESPSPGTHVEIRAASGTNPSLQGSKVIGQGDLKAGTTDVPVRASKPTSHVLVWVTKLTENGRYSSQIDEITVKGRPAA